MKKFDARSMLQIAMQWVWRLPRRPAFAAVTDQAHENWKQAILAHPAPAEGCYHAAFPSTLWVKDQCFPSPHRYLAPPRQQNSRTGEWQTVGNGNDDVIETASTIKSITGTFPTVTGVKSEKGVGVSSFGGGGILGANEYTLQINSGYDLTTSACQSHSGCTVWQQAVYSPDYDVQGSAAVFIEYWLLGWGSSSCPSSWDSDGSGDCVLNSNYTAAPDEPITQLGNEKLFMSATSGGNDVTTFTDGSTAYTFSGKDSVLKLATAWNKAEFNVVGNAGGSEAKFNTGSSVTVKIAASDGSTATPTCDKDNGSTGETNNLTLKTCTATGGSTPYIEFTESN